MANSNEIQKSIVGAAVTRIEDPPLVRGHGLFAADVSFPRQLHMRVVRSPIAHGRIRRVDTTDVLAAPGVVAAWTGEYLADLSPIDFRDDRVEKLVPPKKGQKHVLRVVREILAAEPEGTGTDLSIALGTLCKVARRRSVAFVLSDFFASGYERALSLASARHDVVPVMLVDPRDEEMPDIGLANFRDLESGEDILVDTSDDYVRAHYKASMRALRQRQVDLFRKFGLDHCLVYTHEPYIGPLRELFARRAKRAHR